MTRPILVFGAASLALHLCVLTWPHKVLAPQAMTGRPLAVNLRPGGHTAGESAKRDTTRTIEKAVMAAHAAATPVDSPRPRLPTPLSSGELHAAPRLEQPRPPETPTNPAADTARDRMTPGMANATPGEVVREIQRVFSARFTYPILARRHGWQGRARFGMQVESDGRLTRIRVLQGSGYGVLDRAALDTLQTLRLPAGGYLPRSNYDIDLVVDYRLTAGT